MAIGSALSVGLIGLKAFIIQIQAFVSPGLPTFPSSDFPTPRFPKRGNVSNPHVRPAVPNGRKHRLRSIFAGVHAQTRILTRSGDRSERA